MADADLCEVPMNSNVKHEPPAGDERTALPAAELNGKPLPERVLIAPLGGWTAERELRGGRGVGEVGNRGL